MAATGAVQTGLEIATQNAMAEAQAEAAVNAAIADYNTLQEQQREINQQSNLEQIERQKQAMRERSRLIVAMSEAGISGNSPMREIANSFQQESYDIGIIKENKENQLYGNRKQQEAVHANAKSRVNAAKSNMISPALAALQIGSGAVSGYVAGDNLSKVLRGG